jgi:hypothetical protein
MNAIEKMIPFAVREVFGSKLVYILLMKIPVNHLILHDSRS